MSRDRLLALCAPPNAVDDKQVKEGKQGKIHRTLNTWKSIGVFIEGPDTEVSLAEEFRKLPPFDVDRFRHQLLDVVIDIERDALQEGGSGSDAHDLFELASWALLQDPFAFEPGWEQVERLMRQQGALLVNRADPWRGFLAWAPFFGVAARATRAGFVLNPAQAMRRALGPVFGRQSPGEASDLTIDDFLSRLSKRLPFLDGGDFSRSVQQRIKQPWRAIGSTEVAPCISLALLQLDHERAIHLEDRADSPGKRVMLGRGGRSIGGVTHVVLESGDV